MVMIEMKDAPMVIMSIGLGVMLVLEQLIPAVVNHGGRVRHAVTNLSLGLLNGVGIGLIATPVLVIMSGWIEHRNFGLARMVDMPWLGLLLFDGWMYAWHRANHELGLLWRFHRLHHEDVASLAARPEKADSIDNAMDVTTTVRFHPVEIALSTLARLIVMPLLGLTIGDLFFYEALLFPVILIQHGNIRFPEWLDRPLRLALATPAIHRIHHSETRVERDSNYGSVLSIWDRIGGTFRLRSDTRLAPTDLPS
jgi:sterol desaturase/sphingolipid hydroxylase (fatty acid hydroxylase superfamily)